MIRLKLVLRAHISPSRLFFYSIYYCSNRIHPVAKIRITINSKEVIRATSLLFRNGSGRSSRLAFGGSLPLLYSIFVSFTRERLNTLHDRQKTSRKPCKMLKVYIEPVLCLLLKYQSILGSEEVVGSNPVAPASLVFSRLQGLSNCYLDSSIFYA